MTIYTIIAGVSGTGKSSLTGVLRQLRNDLGFIIDVHKIAAAHGGNKILAARLAITRIRDCLAKRICFTQETTLSGSLTAHTAKQAHEAGYYVRMYYVGLGSAEESLTRIQNRVRKGGHDITADDVRCQFAVQTKSLAKVLPYCNEAVFYDNENGFAAVAEYRNGLITCIEGAPKWIQELADKVLC